MKLIKAMLTVGGLTGVSRILGFIRDVLTAIILGAGPLADAFIIALKLPNFFRRITAEGAFSVSFVPLYTKKLEQEGEQAAASFASNAASVMFVILTPFTILAIVLMPWLIHVIAPGFQVGEERYELAVELTRVTFPYLLLISLSALMGGILSAHEKFAPFAAAPIVFNISLIAALYFLTPYVETGGHALSWGLFASGVLQIAGLFYCVKRYRIGLYLKKPVFNDDIKNLFKLMGPGVIGAGVIHINLFADVIIASTLPEGAISYLYYADRLNQLPLGIVGIAVGTALLPMLSRTMAGNDIEMSRNLYNRALEICLILSLPAGMAMLVAAEPIIKALFEHGAFGSEDARVTALVLMGYALGVPAYVAGKVFSTTYYARHDTVTPVKIAVICALLNIGFALVLIRFIGVAGIALSTGIAGWIQFFALLNGLKRSGYQDIKFDRRFLLAIPKIVISSLLMAAVLLIITHYGAGYFNGTKTEKIMALGVLVASGFLTYFSAVILSGAIKTSEIKHFLKRKKA